MGGPRTAGTQFTAGPGAPAEPGARRPRARGRAAAVAAYLACGLVLFVIYLRLSQTYPLNSDSANILLAAGDLLHGHLLLHGWYLSDVSFYPTELVQYALLEALLGLHMQTAHVAAAMTYTLTFLLAVLLARSSSAGRAAWAATLVAAGIMAAPQFGLGVFALDLSVGHIGTAVPLLVTWLLLDKAPRCWPGMTPPVPPARAWWVPVATALLLTWVLVADPIVYVVGVGPLGLVSALWVIRGLARGEGGLKRRIAARWYELSLGVAAVAAVVLAWSVNNVLSALGGYVVNRLPFYLTPWHDLHDNAPAAWKVLEIFGANYAGLSGIWLALAFLHMASVLLVGWALCRVARRFYRVSLVDEVLAAAIVLNVVLYLLTNASDEAAHEVAVIVPFGAALAARVLIAPALAGPGPAGRVPGRAGGYRRLARRAAAAAGILVLAGYAAGLGYEISQPEAAPANTSLAAWLTAHHFRYGLSGYWTSSSVTVDSGGKVRVRALMQYTLKPDLWMSNEDWYNPGLHYADFVVLDSEPGYFSHWEPTRLVSEYFGRPARTYRVGVYTVLSYRKNLLDDLPGRARRGRSRPAEPGGASRARLMRS